MIAVETEGADSLAQSIAAGERIVLPRISSIATSLGARQVAPQAFALSREHPMRSVVVADRAAALACIRFMHDHRVVVEPACGATLAVAYDAGAALGEFCSVLVIVCGGVTATVPQLQQWAAQD